MVLPQACVISSLASVRDSVLVGLVDGDLVEQLWARHGDLERVPAEDGQVLRRRGVVLEPGNVQVKILGRKSNETSEKR